MVAADGQDCTPLARLFFSGSSPGKKMTIHVVKIADASYDSPEVGEPRQELRY